MPAGKLWRRQAGKVFYRRIKSENIKNLRRKGKGGKEIFGWQPFYHLTKFERMHATEKKTVLGKISYSCEDVLSYVLQDYNAIFKKAERYIINKQ